MDLAKEIYRLTEKFPRSELYGLTAQMRRATVSIPSNIAEGYARRSAKEYRYFYAIAYGSALELETHGILAKDLHFASSGDFQRSEAVLLEVLKMLNSMSRKISKLNASH